ncbi:MAG: radical SAM protein, partial [Oscillospiraceae bacterium]
SISFESLKNLKSGGFTRVSFGVQSTDDETLKILGRRHTALDAFTAINDANYAGFKHISADLMLAVPSQTKEKVIKDIEELSKLPLDHISAYILKLEPNTAFYKLYTDLDDDISADFYLTAVEELENKGFCQYEISNFAKSEGSQSRHNLKYWLLDDYLGIGPSAHSLIDKKRFYFERNLGAFIKSPHIWNDTCFESDGNTEEEKIMLNLRLKSGLDCNSLGEIGKRIIKHGENPKFNGFLKIKNGVISLTPRGFLISNLIISEFISL